MSNKVITWAVTGSFHASSASAHLPVTVEKIAEAAIDVAEVGATIAQLYARNPIDGGPDQSSEAFEPFLRGVKQHSDVVVNVRFGVEDSSRVGAGKLIRCYAE